MDVLSINSANFAGIKTPKNIYNSNNRIRICKIFEKFQDKYIAEQRLKSKCYIPKNFWDRISFALEDFASKF